MVLLKNTRTLYLMTASAISVAAIAKNHFEISLMEVRLKK